MNVSYVMHLLNLEERGAEKGVERGKGIMLSAMAPPRRPPPEQVPALPEFHPEISGQARLGTLMFLCPVARQLSLPTCLRTLRCVSSSCGRHEARSCGGSLGGAALPASCVPARMVWRGRRALAVCRSSSRGRGWNSELLIGDCLCLVCFTLYKQLMAITLLPTFPG